MERGGGGKLVATSSIGEICGMPRQEHYATTKAGLSSLVRSLAVEFAKHDVQVNAILPGWIRTSMTDYVLDSKPFKEKVLPRIPHRRWGQPEDFGGIAVYLASDASAYHTGDTLLIDGGYSAF